VCQIRRLQKSNHCPGNRLFKNAVTFLWMWGGVSSHWKTTFGLRSLTAWTFSTVWCININETLHCRNRISLGEYSSWGTKLISHLHLASKLEWLELYFLCPYYALMAYTRTTWPVPITLYIRLWENFMILSEETYHHQHLIEWLVYLY